MTRSAAAIRFTGEFDGWYLHVHSVARRRARSPAYGLLRRHDFTIDMDKITIR